MKKPSSIKVTTISSEVVFSPYKTNKGIFLLPKSLAYSGLVTRLVFVPKGRQWAPGIDLGDSILSSTRDVTPWTSAEIEYLIAKKGFSLAKSAIYKLMNLEITGAISRRLSGKI